MIPNTCISIALNEFDMNVKEHISESPENIVFLRKTGKEVIAACATRSEISQFAKVFYKCPYPSMRIVHYTNPIYRIDVFEYPIYVNQEDFEMIHKSKIQFFMVNASSISYLYTISKETYEGTENFMSADHCQEGSSKNLSSLEPISVSEIRSSEIKQESNECQKITNGGLRCLQKNSMRISINDECYQFCKDHYLTNMRNLFQILTSNAIRILTNGSRYEVHLRSLIISIPDQNSQIIVDLRLDKNDKFFDESNSKMQIERHNMVDYLNRRVIGEPLFQISLGYKNPKNDNGRGERFTQNEKQLVVLFEGIEIFLDFQVYGGSLQMIIQNDF